MEEKKKWQLVITAIVILAIIAVMQGVELYRLHRNNQTVHKPERTPLGRAVSVPAYAMKMPATPIQRRSAYDPFAEDDWGNPFQQMEQVERRMAALMGRMAQSFDSTSNMSRQSMGFDFAPSADLEDAGDHWIIRFDVPGLEKDKIQLEVQNGMLTVRGERKSESTTDDQKKGFYSSEIQYGSFARSIALPASADEGKVDASYDKGVLIVKIGKKTKEEAGNHQVVVK